jgi:hypothetical protein
VEPFAAGEVRTGAAYEAVRSDARARLAESAAQRRVDLGDGLVLVFETRETVRAALEELLRSERIGEAERVAAEAAALGNLLPGDHELAATLYIDIADPVALAERLAEVRGVASTLFLEVGGGRIGARADPGEDGTGAFRLVFAPDEAQRAALLGGSPVRAVVDHPRCRTSAALTADQVRAVVADLRR